MAVRHLRMSSMHMIRCASSFTKRSMLGIRSNSILSMLNGSLHQNAVGTYSSSRSFHLFKPYFKSISTDKAYVSNIVQPKPGPVKLSWIDTSSWVPDWARPYLHLARADKQVGTMLLLWPCCWSVALGAPIGSLPDFLLMGKFALGAIVMRSAGCTINDLWDKDFDKNVQRTRNRPIANGSISVPQAIGFLGVQLSAGLGILLTFNFNSILLGICSMPLVIVYPLMKRFTNWPQLILGLTFNWGALMGWTAIHGVMSLPHTLPLYLSGVCWTLVYDTLYGYQDRKDDKKLGLKSTSLYLGDQPQVPLTIIAMGSIAGLTTTGLLAGLTMPFYIGVSGVASHLLWQIWTADVDDPTNLWSRFNSNKYVGGIITAAIVAGHF